MLTDLAIRHAHDGIAKFLWDSGDPNLRELEPDQPIPADIRQFTRSLAASRLLSPVRPPTDSIVPLKLTSSGPAVSAAT